MTGGQPSAQGSWRSVIVALLTVEAIAVAIWLIPASIHIVKWPPSGPLRLALLAPAWQLLMLLGAGLVVPAIPPVRRLLTRMTPLLLLWLWAVPYLPWLADRLPLLLVLAGPLRWVIAGAALVSILARATTGDRFVVSWASRPAIFVVSAAVYLGLGIYSARTTPVGGDEPHYLIIAESLINDHDLKIENNHRQRDYLKFYGGDLRPDFFERGKNGEIYSIHAPGLPVLVLPAYAIGGRLGVVALLALIAALTALAIFDLANAIAGSRAALVAWAATCLTIPFLPHAWLIFPEMPGALVVAWAALWLWQPVDRPLKIWIWRGIALGTLTWLHTKFVVFLAIFAGALAWRLIRRPRELTAFLLPIAISSGLWLYYFYAIYGVLDPEAPYGVYTSEYVLTRNIPHGLIGIFFDQKFGLFFYSPIYIAAIAGAWLMLRRKETRYLGAVLAVVVAAFVGTTARLYMFWGGNSAPARFLVPMLPCLAAMVALAVSHARGAVSRAVVGLWLAISIGIAVGGVVRPDRFLLFSDAHVGGARIVEAIQASAPLADAVPTFSNPDWADHIPQLALWILAATIAILVATLAARFRPKSGAGQIAGLTCLTFLLVGSIMFTTPSAAARLATAFRGDLDVLWQFDGTKFRTLDYETLTRATPERFRELTTMAIEPQRADVSPDKGFVTAPLLVPPGAYEARVWFADETPRDGEVLVSMSPQITVGQVTGSLANPAVARFDLPVMARRLTVSIPEPAVAAGASRLEIAPLAVVPAGEREDVRVRSIEPIPGGPGYLIYSDEQAYPEGGIFWSRGTAETRVWVAPEGRSRMTLILSTGPMSGNVTIAVAGKPMNVAMVGGELKELSFDVSGGPRVVPVSIQSDVMFRPAERDKTSTDRRGLGCQVRVKLE